MKKQNIILAVFVIGILFCCLSCVVNVNMRTIKGNGNIITSEKNVSSFEEIRMSGGVSVNYYASDEYRVRLTVDSNLAEYVEITTKGNVLSIEVEDGSYSFTKFVVDIYSPHISKITISGSGNFEAIDKMNVQTFRSKITGSGKIKGNFECTNFDVCISGSGNINGMVKCDDFSVRISGSGNVTLVGSAKKTAINISGSGSFEGSEFKINNATFRVNGSGKINTQVEDYLDASISGSGNIQYRGNPETHFSVSGSGKINSVKD